MLIISYNGRGSVRVLKEYIYLLSRSVGYFYPSVCFYFYVLSLTNNLMNILVHILINILIFVNLWEYIPIILNFFLLLSFKYFVFLLNFVWFF